MRFTTPLALILLLSLPLVAWLGWPARGFTRWRESVSLGLRILILLCLILSLAGLEIGRASDRLAVVFLIDASDSLPDQAQEAAIDYVRQAIERMGPDDQSAVIVFGGDALVERPMSSSRDLGVFRSIPDSGQTDLSAAVRLGIALYPPEYARRMVILSDGLITAGDSLAAARLAAASGVQILALPFITEPGAEALVTSVSAPYRLRQGETFHLQLTLEANRAIQTGIRVLANGQPVYNATENLERGEQSFSLPVTAGPPGFYRYQVQIDPEQDGFDQNNEMVAFSIVSGPPKILVVAPASGEDEARHLLAALEITEYDVRSVPPVALPSDLAELAQYEGVVLVNVPARELSQRQMEAVQSYVRDLGGGLVVVGGPNSYGVGGYFRTPLEAALPVEMQIKDEQRRPSLAMVFIVDHSGSMSDLSGGATKLDLAKEAAIRSVDLLFPNDRIGVIAFDQAASWVVPMTDLSNPAEVKNAIASLRSGGGTDILAGIQALAEVLPTDPAQVKHAILLTDGGADPAGIPELVSRLNQEEGITLTTIGIGQDAAPFLPTLAELGGGRYHFTPDPGTIPSIFTEETTLASRAYLIEHAFSPQIVSGSSILAGIDSIPPLLGYVGTTAKSTARTLLASDLGDPILASWQYGLGRSVAFTSDATSRWGQAWIGWDEFPSFWAQAVRYTLNQPGQQASLDIRVENSLAGLANQQANLIVEARSPEGNYLNQFELTARVVAPDGDAEALTLQQVAPGKYQAPFDPEQSGAYLIGVAGIPNPQSPPAAPSGISETTGWALPYSAEYRLQEPDPQILLQIAGLTGGFAASREPGDVFAHNLPAPRSTRPAWPWLIALAALLLPLDVGIRRLAITSRDIQRGWFKLKNRYTPSRPKAAPVKDRPDQVNALLRAKQRALRQENILEKSSTAGVEPESTDGEHSNATGESDEPAPLEAGTSDPAIEQVEQEKHPETTAARLLEHKRGRKKGSS